VNPHVSSLQQQGIEALPTFVNIATIALADSGFSPIDLARAGYANVVVQPIPFLPARFTERARRRFDGVFARFRTRLLFVGRVAPNKRHDQLVRIAARYIFLQSVRRLCRTRCGDVEYCTAMMWSAVRNSSRCLRCSCTMQACVTITHEQRRALTCYEEARLADQFDGLVRRPRSQLGG
jgi:hypothetical protein